MTPRGLFLCLEGLDGTGKSTQCRLLADWLQAQGLPVLICRDPGGTAVGERIRELLLDRGSHGIHLVCEAFLYMASRAQLVHEVIRPALAQGKVVVSDRFLLANVVYQGHAGGMNPEELWSLGRIAVGECLPDLTLVLDMEPAAALARKPLLFDRMESKGLEFAQRVRRGYLAEARRWPEAIRVLDADRPVPEVAQAVQQEVRRVLERHPGT
jgi:dTMP kinase